MTDQNVNLFDTLPTGTVPFADVALRLHPTLDNVGIVKQPLQEGQKLEYASGNLTVRQFIRASL